MNGVGNIRKCFHSCLFCNYEIKHNINLDSIKETVMYLIFVYHRRMFFSFCPYLIPSLLHEIQFFFRFESITSDIKLHKSKFQILDGLCRQTGKFSKNCLALVDEYYLAVYNFLMSEVQPKEICEAVGLCGLNSVFKKDVSLCTYL